MRILAAAIAVAAVLSAAPAAAQDPDLEPHYETIHLSANFRPDPRSVLMQSGGAISASDIRADCKGFISTPPDVRLVYSAGALPLIISAHSLEDTTLVVNAPDGTWHCDDDSGPGRWNPSLSWDAPQSGAYDIWVGSYSEGTLSEARLYISEIRSQ